MSTELKVVMFTDQVSSTRNMTRRTPAEIRQVAREQDDLTADVVKQCRGTILKDTGDGHFIEFPSCADAVRCGFLLQRRVAERNASQTDERLRFDLHVGIDFGEAVVLPGGDLRANTANLAARVCSACPAGEVYFTEKVMRELNTREANFEKVEAAKLKGVRGRVNIFRLLEWRGTIENARNPFIWRDGITKPSDFFDREVEQRALGNFLRGGQNCQVVGPRRSSKTSLLRRIEYRAPEWMESAVVSYVDLQDPRCFTLSGWLSFASRQLHRPTPAATLAEFIEHVEEMLAKGRRLVLCLDEFEELTKRREEFKRDFFLTLRACGQKGMSIVTASGRPLSELTESGDPTSPFYNTFPLVRLGPFAAADAEDFVNLYRPGVPRFTAGESQVILDFAKCHPLALQVACFHVLEAKGGVSLAAAIQKAADEMKALLPDSW
jgi:class 3 adenylate cyclase